MTLIDRQGIEDRIRQLDQALGRPLDLIIVGGAAVVALVDNAEATRDIDLIRTAELDHLYSSKRDRVIIDLAERLGFSTRSDSFEVHLPQSWMDRISERPEMAGEHIRVFVPCAEDLAVMKLFRFNAKDESDIERLTALPEFDFDCFLAGFLDALPVAIGHHRFHAQSFTMVWNTLLPARGMTTDQVLEAARA